MGRSPQRDRGPDHLPAVAEAAGAGRRQGGALVVRVQLLDDYADLRGQRRLLLRPPARAGTARRVASTFLPQGVAPYLAPDATALGQIFWYTVERPAHRRPRPAVGAAEILHRPAAQLGARRGRGRHGRRHAPGVPDRRGPERPAGLRHHAGRALRRRGPQQLRRRRPRHPEEQRRVPGPLRRLDQGTSRTSRIPSSHGARRHADLRQERGRGAARASSSAAASSRRTATRSSAASS